MSVVVENQILNESHFSEMGLQDLEIIDCKIENCDFSDQELKNCQFVNTTFSNCNLSMIKINNTQFNDVSFIDSKILGVNFCKCTGILFEVNFRDCILDFCSFEKMKMHNTEFIKVSMVGVDFAEANLQKARFLDVDLQDAIFARTNLTEADLSTAVNFRISPNQNTIKKAVFSESNLRGLLNEFNIKII